MQRRSRCVGAATRDAALARNPWRSSPHTHRPADPNPPPEVALALSPRGMVAGLRALRERGAVRRFLPAARSPSDRAQVRELSLGMNCNREPHQGAPDDILRLLREAPTPADPDTLLTSLRTLPTTLAPSPRDDALTPPLAHLITVIFAGPTGASAHLGLRFAGR